jgi:hypothetical protein
MLLKFPHSFPYTLKKKKKSQCHASTLAMWTHLAPPPPSLPPSLSHSYKLKSQAISVYPKSQNIFWYSKSIMGFKCQVLVCTFCLVMLLFLQETRAGIHSSNASRLNGRKKVSGCNLFRGRWVVDTSYPLYDSSGCPFIDDEFNCQKYGRRDNQYLKYSWQPDSCKIPRY